ncbi:acetoin utilization deacetylase AcuC-like enzyme [Rhizobium subbaraonis]|uniref:Acetoin utilization deacetylase AcuC-like enzyme n=1 Tax=Rhizobium subbaraonis TaxID=908946 RepID=A0A285U261_9HYPH|nr:histone deacetylase family protein [Rhizobium subbaraonis]SOC35793.1 acetoin utilization deacetylase AcuC-like enzyme [Rhizobium subbaraonis]
MKTFYTADHHLHHSGMEVSFGSIVETFEKPERAQIVLSRIKDVGLGPVLDPQPYGRAPIERVHTPDYLDFLENVFAEWRAAGRDGEVWPYSWRHRSMPPIDSPPSGLDARLSYYSFDMAGSITETTSQAARRAADTALAGADAVLAGDRAAFSLCRPPGHHAGRDFFGGYCYLNNAAIAAQRLRDGGHERVAIFDIDYHHGNGTQEIFYDRADVLLASLHGDPDFEFPFHLGYARERGAGAGEGFNLNYPLPAGTGWAEWREAFEDAHERIRDFQPSALVVSLGVDTFKDDPISQFNLDGEHFLVIGARIAAFDLPTLFVMEGGYAVDALGINAVNVLQGFERA